MESKLIIILSILAFSGCSVSLRANVESLCPDSIHFIMNAYKSFTKVDKHAEIADIDLVFYGKASVIEEKGVQKVQCQHGPTECLGNAALVCMREQLADKKTFSEAVIAFFDNYHKDRNLQSTLSKVLADEDIRENVFVCAQKEMDSKVAAEEPKVAKDIHSKHVPYYDLYVDGEHLHEDSWYYELKNDVLTLLCSKSKSQACSK